MGLNAFRLAGGPYFPEMTHSNIIKTLLENGPHAQSIPLFIAMLNRLSPVLRLSPGIYVDAEVKCEPDRIDILLKSPKNKRCIIVENKINDAPDQDKQLSRYLTTTKKRGLAPEAIVYLSKDGKAPSDRAFDKSNRAEVESILLRVAAFADNAQDLVNGWLRPLAEVSTDEDLRHLIRQYIDILTEVGKHTMNTQTEDKFLEWMKSDDNREHAERLVTLCNDRMRIVLRQITEKYDDAEVRRRRNITSTRLEWYRGGWMATVKVRIQHSNTVVIEISEMKSGSIGLTTYGEPGNRSAQAMHGSLKDRIARILSVGATGYMEFAWPKDEDKLHETVDRLLEFFRGLSQAPSASAGGGNIR